MSAKPSTIAATIKLSEVTEGAFPRWG